MRRTARRRVGLANRELYAGAIVRLPRQAAGPRRFLAVDEEFEGRRNSDEAFDLQAGTFGR